VVESVVIDRNHVGSKSRIMAGLDRGVAVAEFQGRPGFHRRRWEAVGDRSGAEVSIMFH
jgi:hypothetical protein